MSLQQDQSIESQALTFRQVLVTWLPLVASWMLMSIELPTINAIVARLSNPEINLAAYGGVVFPIALTIEAPVIMLLAASTALSRDWESYQRLKKYTLWMGGILMGVHVLVALTPIYDFIVDVLLSSPKEIIEPARLSLLMLSPWTLGIAYRRFQQGAMIRFGHSRMVGETTFVRLITVVVVLTVGMVLKTIPGAILAALAQGLGVSMESIYAGLRIRKIRSEIKAAPTYKKPLTLRRFISFYFPLAITSSLWLFWQPLISGTVSRMPNPLESLAVWSLVTGILFMFRSPGVAFNEAVVALQRDAKSFSVLQKFARLLSLITTLFAIAFIVTPLSRLWFTYIANLRVDLVTVAILTLVIGTPLPFISMYISLFQGIIVNQEKTSIIAEAVLIFLLSMGAVLGYGLITKAYKGVYITSAAFAVAHLAQCLWLLLRSRKQRKLLVQDF
ncbi:MAG: hypothetical protein U9R53_03775 [Chloroflexota bacterium]|nr:hypothetical protein [Chloroflexota bacterium]